MKRKSFFEDIYIQFLATDCDVAFDDDPSNAGLHSIYDSTIDASWMCNRTLEDNLHNSEISHFVGFVISTKS